MKKLIPNLDFQKIWKNTYTSYAEPFCTDLHFKILHQSTKTNEYMHKCTHDVKPNYDYCKQVENNIHLFATCPRINQIWTNYQPTLTNLTKKTKWTKARYINFKHRKSKQIYNQAVTNNNTNNIIRNMDDKK